MSERKWQIGDEVLVSNSQYYGNDSVEWEEPGIIDAIDEDEGIAWVMVREGNEIDIPLSELVAY